MHPIHALQALDRVHTNTTPTDCTGECSRVAKKVKPGPDTMSFVFFMLTLSPLRSIPSFHNFNLAMHSSSESAITATLSARHTSTELVRQSFQHKYEKQGAENRSLMHTNSNPKLLAVLTVDTYTAFDIRIHALDETYSPLLNSQTSQGPPKNFPGYSVESLLQVNKGEVKWLVCSDVLLLQSKEDEDGISEATTWHKAKLHSVNVHQLLNEGNQHTLKQLHNLIC